MASAAERQFFRSGLELDVRGDGRPRLGLRPVAVQQETQAYCNGSCTVDNDEAIVTAVVTSDVGAAPDGKATGSLGFRVIGDATLSVTEVRAQERRLLSLLEGLYAGDDFDTAQLFIGDDRAFRLTVTVQVARQGGNLLALASLAVKGALLCTRLPTATVTVQHEEVFVTLNKQQLQPPLHAATAPTFVALNVSGDHYFVDGTAAEELLADAVLTLGYGKDHHVVSSDMRLGGRVGVHPTNLRSLITEAAAIADQQQAILAKLTTE